MSQQDNVEASSSIEESEVVERDGEKVVRVKKRKRRSTQKKDEVDTASKASLFKFIITIVSIAMLLAVGSVLVMMYVNGRSFESKVEASIAEELGGEVTVAGLSVSPLTFTAKSLTFHTGGDYLLQALTLDEIKADHRGYGLLGGKWIGDEIAAKSGSLIVDFKKPFMEPIEDPALSHSYGGFRCNSMDITLKGNNSDHFIKGAEVIGRMGELSLRGGELEITWPKNLTLKSVKFESGETSKVVGAIIFEKKEEVGFNGEFKAGVFDLESEIKHLSVARFVPQLSLLMRGDLKLKNAKIQGNLNHLILTGKFKANRFAIYTSGVKKLFERLEIYEETYLYSEVEAEGLAIVSEKGLKLQGLKVVKEDEFELSGNFEASGNRLSARLALKVPEEKKDVILNDPLLSRLCVKQADGSYRVTIRIGGTLKNPTDDLSARIQGGKFGEMESSDKELLEKQLEQLLSK